MKVWTLLASLVVQTSVFAQTDLSEWQLQERVLRDATSWTVVELSPETVFCREGGYGIESLKVSIPDLQWLSAFDHRALGEVLPCVNAGPCGSDLNPDRILDKKNPFEVAAIRLVIHERLRFHPRTGECLRSQWEYVATRLRGVPFYHSAEGAEQSVPRELCENSFGLF